MPRCQSFVLGLNVSQRYTATVPDDMNSKALKVVIAARVRLRILTPEMELNQSLVERSVHPVIEASEPRMFSHPKSSVHRGSKQPVTERLLGLVRSSIARGHFHPCHRMQSPLEIQQW
jgi:hypothetical protein